MINIIIISIFKERLLYAQVCEIIYENKLALKVFHIKVSIYEFLYK